MLFITKIDIQTQDCKFVEFERGALTQGTLRNGRLGVSDETPGGTWCIGSAPRHATVATESQPAASERPIRATDCNHQELG